MARDERYKGAWIRDYSSTERDGKFYNLLDDENKNEETIFILKGLMRSLLHIIAESEPDKRGWAYDSGHPITDKETARKLSVTDVFWRKWKKILIDLHLIHLDPRGAWGQDKIKWEYYQGAEERRKNYNRSYHRKDVNKHTNNPEIPLPPDTGAVVSVK
jgi:hypothetical protein